MTFKPSVTHHGAWTHRAMLGLSSVRGGALAGMALFLPMAVSACVRAPLVPLMSSDEHGVVTLEREGIELTAELKVGVQHLPDSVTPIRITVTNRSDNGIYVDPDDIELSTGEEAVAWETIPREELPPPRALGLGMDPASPYASAQGASASSGAASGYFGLSPSTSYVSGTWRDPTSESWISSTALTAGFVDIGESRRGYVYFATPPEGIERINLRVRVRLGSGSGPAETFEIPYGVPG